MTNVYVERDGNRYLISADGHAGDRDVCNMITGIMYAFAGYVENMEAAGEAAIFNAVYPQSTEEAAELNGKMLFEVSGDERVEAAYDMAVIGLVQLAASFPENVSVSEGKNE